MTPVLDIVLEPRLVGNSRHEEVVRVAHHDVVVGSPVSVHAVLVGQHLRVTVVVVRVVQPRLPKLHADKSILDVSPDDVVLKGAPLDEGGVGDEVDVVHSDGSLVLEPVVDHVVDGEPAVVVGVPCSCDTHQQFHIISTCNPRCREKQRALRFNTVHFIATTFAGLLYKNEGPRAVPSWEVKAVHHDQVVVHVAVLPVDVGIHQSQPPHLEELGNVSSHLTAYDETFVHNLPPCLHHEHRGVDVSATRSVIEIHGPHDDVLGDEREHGSSSVFGHICPRDGAAGSPVALHVVESTQHQTEDGEGGEGHDAARPWER